MSDFHGLAAHAAGAQLLSYKYDPGGLAPNDVTVKISHCGVCHSDLHLINNDWGISHYPFIPGHEIVGTIVEVGSAVRDRKLGERVGIGWQADSCGICEWCRRGEEHLCPLSQPTCVGRNGGYADNIRVNARFAIPVPKVLESENVAPLLCGGITVYAPLRNHLARPASRVGVIGIGGLGHMGLQFANAFGCEVTAFSTSKDKEAEARELGAHNFVNTRDTGAIKKVAGSFDLILSTISADQDFQTFIGALRPKGTLVRRRRLAVSHFRFSAFQPDRRPESHLRQPHRQPDRSARDARSRRPPQHQGHHRALPHERRQRSHRQGQKEPGPLSRCARQLDANRSAGGCLKRPSSGSPFVMDVGRLTCFARHSPGTIAEMRFELFIAARYLRARRRQAVVGFITVISVIGVAAGVAALIIALAITNGMRRDLQERLVGATSHVDLMRTAGDGIRDWRPLMARLAATVPHVQAVAPGLYGQVLVSRGPRSGGALIKGIIPADERKVGELLQSIKQGSAYELNPLCRFEPSSLGTHDPDQPGSDSVPYTDGP